MIDRKNEEDALLGFTWWDDGSDASGTLAVSPPPAAPEAPDLDPRPQWPDPGLSGPWATEAPPVAPKAPPVVTFKVAPKAPPVD